VRVRAKICGLTNIADARAACELGADALGFVLAKSPRQVSPDQVKAMVADLPPLVTTVGVLVGADLAMARQVREYCGLDAVQRHGDQTPETVAALGRGVIKVLAVAGRPPDPACYPGALLLLDTHVPGKAGGTGRVFDWSLARDIARMRPIMLAGGLNPDNVEHAIQTVRPHAVDVSSGVESAPGRKDHVKLADFLARVRAA
jgi:phosphoribosylanthranilate isomerase